MKRFFAGLLLVGIFVGIYFLYKIPNPVMDRTAAPQPAFESFVATETNGSYSLTGVYAPGLFAFPLTPFDASGHITDSDNLVMYWQSNQTTFLEAHASLAGEHFKYLSAGQEIRIVFGTGDVKVYHVSNVEHYQVIVAPDGTNRYVADSGAGVSYSYYDFLVAHLGNDQVVLITCIGKDVDGSWNSSWGRLVITAKP